MLACNVTASPSFSDRSEPASTVGATLVTDTRADVVLDSPAELVTCSRTVTWLGPSRLAAEKVGLAPTSPASPKMPLPFRSQRYVSVPWPALLPLPSRLTEPPSATAYGPPA